MKNPFLFLLIGLISFSCTSKNSGDIKNLSDTQLLNMLYSFKGVTSDQTSVSFSKDQYVAKDELQKVEGSKITASIDTIVTISDSEKVVITTANSEDNACDNCGPALGIGLVTHTDGGWKVEGDLLHFTSLGSFGEVFPYHIVVIPEDKIAIIVSAGDTGQGYTTESSFIYRFVNEKFKLVNTLEDTYGDNAGVCEESEGNCWKYQTEISFPEKDLMITKLTGTQEQNGSVVRKEETLKYVFSNGTYELVK